MRDTKSQLQKRLEKRRNLLPSLALTFALWLTLVGTVMFINPEIPSSLPIFIVLIFLVTFFTVSLVFGNKLLGIISTIFIGTIFSNP